jgi:thioredoxin-like negative regulator of GroEL
MNELINNQGLLDLIKNNDKIILIAGATWCGPCKRVPITEMKELINMPIFKFDVEICEDFSREYNIKSLPTVMLFVQGKLVGNIVGLSTADKYQKWVSEHIQI